MGQIRDGNENDEKSSKLTRKVSRRICSDCSSLNGRCCRWLWENCWIKASSDRSSWTQYPSWTFLKPLQRPCNLAWIKAAMSRKEKKENLLLNQWFFFINWTHFVFSSLELCLETSTTLLKIDSKSQHKSGFGWFGRGMSIKQGSDANVFRGGFFKTGGFVPRFQELECW